MRIKGRTAVVALATMAAGVIGVAGFAWACTAYAWIEVAPGSGAAGSRAGLNGQEFWSGPVEVRWNSTTGPLLATANGPNFSVEITIPSVRPAVYTLVAVTSGTTVGKASVPFEVTAAAVTESGGFRSGTSSGSEEGGSTAGRTGGAPGDDTAAVSDPTESTGSAGGRTFGNGGTSFPGESAGEEAGSPAATGGETSVRDPAGGPAQAKSSQAVPTGASAATPSSVTSDRGISGATGSTSAAAAAAGPSARTAAGDLWAGLNSADGVPRSAGLIEESTSSNGLAPHVIAMAMGAGGLAMLMAGFAVADIRRRWAVMADSSSQG